MRQVLFNSDEHLTIEEKVSARTESYRYLDIEALYTSSEDFERIFSHPLVSGTFLDLGCGVGHGCLQYAQKFPDRFSIGVEIEEARILEGKKKQADLNLKNLDLRVFDLLNEEIPFADTYFIYFPTGHILDKVLSELYNLNKVFTLVAIESHGDLFSRLNFEKWLELKDEIPLSSERHYPNARVYTSTHQKRIVPEAFQISYLERELIIQDEAGLWTGSSFGLKWEREDEFTLAIPPRTIEWKSVKTLKAKEEFDKAVQQVIEYRKAGFVSIETKNGVNEGFIRKIYLSPSFHLEISTGAKVELSEILKVNIRT